MNNEQFRKLMLASSAKSPGAEDATPKVSRTPRGGSALGSRQRASIPMTPRSVGGAQADFARQLAERNQATRPQKKFRTSAPKGAKLASGYVDRVTERVEASGDDREERLRALDELRQNDEIDDATFEKMRLEIAGGDLESTHLVKGLDFKLLQRVRKGEDVYGETKAEPVEQEQAEPEGDVDDEFDQLENQTVEAVEKSKAERKKGQLSTVQLVPGKKRTRDQILADLRASREAAKAQQESALGGRFQKIGAKKTPGTRIERDGKGREVLIIVDEDGHEKRKVRKLQPEAEPEPGARQNDLLVPDKDAKPLGMEVPEQYRKQEEPKEDSDSDIFADVGDDYDPLADIDGSDSESGEDDKPDEGDKERKDTEADEASREAMPPPPKPSAPRNYFEGSKTGLVSAEAGKAPDMSDPAIMAAIKKAAALNPIGKGEDEDGDDEEAREAKAREERRKKMLQSRDRDDEDMDMGFGTSRFEDEDDFEDAKVKLSEWGQDDGEGGRSRGGQSTRKRGPKKRKGNANNAADVLRVMEQRKKS